MNKLSSKKYLIFIFILFSLWRIGLIIISLLAGKYVPSQVGYLGPQELLGFANFDGLHYLSIAKHNYSQFEEVFFPMFPIIIKLFSIVTEERYILSGILAANISFLLALIFLYKLLILDFPEKIVKKILIILLIFPTSFFYGSIYTESLFLLLITSSWYFFRINKFWLGGILGGFASATRLVGIFILLSILFRTSWKSWLCKKNLPLLFIPLGLLGYALYLQVNRGDFFFFFHSQSLIGTGRTTSSLILPPQLFWRYIKILTTVPISNYQYWISLSELISFVFAGICLWKGRKILSKDYQIYSWLSLIIPTLSGTLMSMPRYLITIFPIYIVLASIKNKPLLLFWQFVSIILLIIATAFFTKGYFIA